MSGSAPVFILSTGRAGSTLMSNIMRSHEDICSISEFWMSLANRAFIANRLDGPAFWRLLTVGGQAHRLVFTPDAMDEYIYDHSAPGARAVGDVPPIMAIVLPHLTADVETVYRDMEAAILPLPERPYAQHVRFLFDWLTEYFGKKLWVERTGASIIFAPALMRLFPEAKFILLARDGRDVALSMSRHGPIRMFIRFWQRFRWLGMNILRPPFLLGEVKALVWLEEVALRLINPRAAMANPVPLDLAGRFWSEMVSAGMDALDRWPADRVHKMRYEDLTANPRLTIRQLTDFIDPALASDDWLDKAARLPTNRPAKWQALDAAEQQLLAAGCAHGLKRLGYRQDSSAGSRNRCMMKKSS